MPESIVYNMDCLEAMRQMQDKCFELAIVDPPYGIGVGRMNMGAGKGARCSKISNRKWDAKDWDHSRPTNDYFDELFRISTRQVIWGGNYFSLPPSQYFAVWHKGAGLEGRSFAECEYAWVSSGGTRHRTLNPVDKDRIHPTQKPIELYRWLLANYAKPGDRILDTHLGSGSSRIAAYDMGFEFTGYELDKDYFEAQEKRFQLAIQQQSLF